MKERNDIDKLLRASLDSYKPSPAASGKDKFLEEAAGILDGKSRPGAWWKPLTIAIILIGLTGGLAWYIVSVVVDKPLAYNSESSTKIMEDLGMGDVGMGDVGMGDVGMGDVGMDDGVMDNGAMNNMIESKKSVDEGQRINPPDTEPTDINKENLTALKENTSIPGALPEAELLEAASARMINKTEDPRNAGPEEIMPEPAPLRQDSKDSASANVEEPDVIPPDSPGKDDISQEEISEMLADTAGAVNDPVTQHPKGGKSMYSAFYKPDFLYNVEDNKKMMHSIGAEYQFRPFHPKYVVRAGVGISISPGYYEYGVDYNQYVGSYQHLDSVTFSLAEDNFHLEATYHQTERQVYDTALQTDYLSTDKRFVYLYIPVMLGYDLVRKDRFTFGLRAGPSLSVLLNKKPDDPAYEMGQNQVVQVNLLTPLRNVMNWQLMGGLNFTFISKKDYFIELEPAFGWYFDQLAGEGKGKNPYTLGLRISVGILSGKEK